MIKRFYSFQHFQNNFTTSVLFHSASLGHAAVS